MVFDLKKMTDDPWEKILWVILIGVIVNVLGSYVSNLIQEARLKKRLTA